MEKRWPPERLKSFEAPRLFIAWATRRPPWTRRSSRLAPARSPSRPRLAPRSRPARGGRRGRRARRRGRSARPPPPRLGRAPASPARARAFFSAAASLRSASLRRFACCWRARRSAASRSLPFFRLGRRGGRGRADQPDRRRALLARQPAAPDRLGDLRVAGRGLQGLAHPGEDLLPHPVLAADRLGRAQQRVDRLLLAPRQPRAASPGRSEPASISSCAARSSSPTSSSSATSLGLPRRQLVDEPGGPARLASEPLTQSAASASPSERSDLASSFRAGVNSSSGPW